MKNSQSYLKGLAGLLCCCCFSLMLFSCSNTDNNGNRDGAPKVLVFSKTAGFKHSSIPNGIAAIEKLGTENGFEVDDSKDGDDFTDENLRAYSAVVFLSSTMDVLDNHQEAAFERYIQSGGGFVGVHAATDTEYGWGWYGKLVGGYFKSHPKTQEAKFVVEDATHPATAHLPKEWVRTDELYNFENLNPDVNVILSIDESSYEGGENGDNHPMAWYHEYDGGRAFYTGLGHTEESYEEENFLKHLLAGIQYAIGPNEVLDLSKATTMIPPDGDRFAKKMLSEGEFFEPTEMTILPNKDVLIAQRHGELDLYVHATGELKEIAKLDVYDQSGVAGVNAEEGFMGLQKDPNYAKNNWIYAFYAPAGNESVNRLSRFKYSDGNWDMSSEQVILDVASQREICCHTGGSIAFGGDGLLYLSTGDNATPFDEPKAEFVNNGFAPLNDLPGKQQYDARRSSANTNDLRGKIIRIRVNEDGSYDIPEGNLFPVGTEKTRPEIYTMGHRNPYRISVDPKNGYLYWGDVGPDSREDKFGERGPMGYDEMNQAKKAGNFGWPLFIADNKAYNDYDYSNGKTGPEFDPAAPINDSRYNTGLRELPPAQGAYVFYNYGKSDKMPGLESGGRNAMAGPTIYNDLYDGPNELPEYYNGKVIIYDWMRGWMKALTLDANGDYSKLEPFAPEIELNNLIDMEVADDGTIYLLEYGSGWFSANDDSGLSFIEYNGGNRPPVISNFEVDKTSGTLPLTVTLTADAKDREGDDVTYKWDFGDGNTKETKEHTITYTYETAGNFSSSVSVIDDSGESVKSALATVSAGNTRPEVAIELSGGNSSFFVPGQKINYKVTVNDAEDGTALDPANLLVTVDYMAGFDEAALSSGHQQVSMAAMGKNLVNAMDCKSCHKEQGASVGPSYMDVSKKYRTQNNAASYLKKKIMEGGSGVWGEVAMAAHPDLSNTDANQIIAYIRGLANTKKATSLPPEGSVIAEDPKGPKVMVITASYTDNGAVGASPLTGIKKIAVKSNDMTFDESTAKDQFTMISFGGSNFMVAPKNGGWFALENIDLSGVTGTSLGAIWQEAPDVPLALEVRLNAPDGELLGTGMMPKPKSGAPAGVVKIKFDKTSDVVADKLYFVYNPKDKDKLEDGMFIGLRNVKFEGK